MRVLGLDPGLRKTGWGIIDSGGGRLRHVANGTVSSGNFTERQSGHERGDQSAAVNGLSKTKRAEGETQRKDSFGLFVHPQPSVAERDELGAEIAGHDPRQRAERHFLDPKGDPLKRIVTLVRSARGANQTSYFSTIAVSLAQDKLEELKANPASLGNGGPVTDTTDGVVFTRNWTVTPNSPVAGVSRVDVQVDWTDYITHTVSISSAVLN